MTEYAKKWQVWITVVLALHTFVPQVRNTTFSLMGIAFASDVKREIAYRDSLTKLSLEYFKTQNKLIEIITDSTLAKNTALVGLLKDSLEDQLHLLQLQIQQMDSTFIPARP